MTAQDDKSIRSSYLENIAASISGASSMTFSFGSGTDDGTNKYLALPEGIAYGFEVMPTVACSITKVNGRSLKSPISIGTGGYRTNNVRIQSITITAGSATVVEVSGKA